MNVGVALNQTGSVQVGHDAADRGQSELQTRRQFADAQWPLKELLQGRDVARTKACPRSNHPDAGASRENLENRRMDRRHMAE